MATEKRMIDANEFHSVLEDIRKECLEDNTMSDNFAAAVIKMVQDILAQTPTVDAVEVVHGQWIEVEATIAGVYRCNICGKSAVMKHNYCNRCGAKMDGDLNG